MPDTAEFLSCDWGSTSFRLRLVARAPFAVLGAVQASRGIRAFTGMAERQTVYATYLDEAITELEAQCGRALAGLPICASGMISSSLGWHELPYASLPFPLDGSGIVSARVTVPRRDGASHPALICSGVAADNDVMRGEECEMMGALAMPAVAQLRENALVLLPGTHTKHIRVRHGAIVDFRTYLTGELLDLLVQHSLLHHSVVMPDADNAGEAFAAGIALAGEMTLSAALFHIRAHHLLHDTSPAENGAMLNGILIGGELHELRACYSTDLPLLLCAGPRHASWFAKGCRLLGLAERLRIVLPDDAALAASRGHAIILDRATKSSIT